MSRIGPTTSSFLSTNDQKKTPHMQKAQPSATKFTTSERYGEATATSSRWKSETIIPIMSCVTVPGRMIAAKPTSTSFFAVSRISHQKYCGSYPE